MPTAAARPQRSSSQFRATFAALKAILQPYEERLRVAQNTPLAYTLETKTAVWRGKPCMFAAVKVAKNYVSYHLMSIYANQAAVAKISPELKKRMQGKSCFNFTAPDEKLFAELEALTAAGAEAFVSGKMFQSANSTKCN